MRLVIVSDEEKKRVLHKCHESAAGAHHGISRTLTLVESSYYWTSVTNDVKEWVWVIATEYFYLVFVINLTERVLITLYNSFTRLLSFASLG